MKGGGKKLNGWIRRGRVLEGNFKENGEMRGGGGKRINCSFKKSIP